MQKSFFTLLVLLCGTAAVVGQEQPNIVLLFVDDLGWADLGYQNQALHTPNIDRLKASGLYFERAYIPTPTCSPSRASLLTGKEAARMQFYRHIPNSVKHGFTPEGRTDEPFSQWAKDPVQLPTRNWLPLEEVTYAEKLKEQGYYNMFVGKWHLGHEDYHPVQQGFDAQFGTGNHGHPGSYIAPFFRKASPLPDAPEGAYLTDVLTDESVRFIEDYDRPAPFMLSHWYYTVHGPHIGRPDLVERYTKEGLSGKYAQYAAMVTALDESVSRILEAVDKKGMTDNTVIVFISDQGGYFDNAPLSGGKTGGNTLGEGGARVPLLISYPGLTRPGSSTSVPVQSIDLFPTFLELASGKKYKDDKIQGKSLLPLLRGKKMKRRDLYFFRSYEDQRSAVISGHWKLKRYHSGKFELYNLNEDLAEENDLIATAPKMARKLKKKLAAWEEAVGVR
ncbi:sulfatase [Neolewinella aurantiaca]|uniref:Sulfatase n=1 Tax=Neolewinella aurantiaca TaxID=2602767 RepID=A0A5C7FNJ7_9BACT|nr:sulfatase [Neolewinella aurantiaca]TXF87967.1 sulfatase [Neolewinella aurantiaca]